MIHERRTWQSVVHRLTLATCVVAAGGCATLDRLSPRASAPLDPPRYAAPQGDAPRIALVLSGGAARGFAHLGVLRVLEREGLRPDLVVGSSAGAIVGALYASGLHVAEIEAAMQELGWGTLVDIDLVRTVLGSLGLARGERLEAFLRERLRTPIERFPIRFAAVTTDLSSGETILFNQGDAARAVRASSAVPGLYEPVEIGARRLVDGQITSPLPVGAARSLGARVVVAVDVVYPPEQSSPTHAVGVLFQSMLISTWRHLMNERALADLVLAPSIEPTSSQFGLGDRDWLVKTGEAAAENALPSLRAAMLAR